MLRSAKVKDLDELAVILQNLRAQGKKVVLAHGVFDLMHVGHIRHLEEARLMGNALVVTLTPDQYVNKGPHRPAFSHDLRAEAVASLGVVDYVAINRWPTSVETIQLLRPSVYAKGPDYKQADQDITGGITAEQQAVQSVGGEIRFTEDITFSSSHLLNEFLSPFEPEVDKYLQDFRRQHPCDEVLEWVNRLAALRPLVVGEAIIDEYLFCEGLGKSNKDPVLAVLQTSIEAYAGGSLAVANHLAGLCGEVRLVTQLGETERREEFVRANLLPNIEPIFLNKACAPTLHKRRIVDRYSGNKLFEIYVMDDSCGGDEARQLQATLTATIPGRDLILAADFGHGLLHPDAVGLLWSSGAFLAVNTQSNAGNRGFNPISKYRRADYVCLAGHEVDMETRQRDGNVREKILEVARRIACPRFTVTQGKSGSLHYDTLAGFYQAPALATRIVDRVGAGDAVFAVTSLLARLGAPWDILAFLGNVAGAHMVSELGNRKTLERVGFSKHITALMK